MAKELTPEQRSLCRISPSVRFETSFKEKYGVNIQVSENYNLPDEFSSAVELNQYVRNIDRYNDGRAKPHSQVMRSLASLASSMVKANPKIKSFYDKIDKRNYSHLSHLTNGVSSKFSLSDIEFYTGQHFKNLAYDNRKYKSYVDGIQNLSDEIGIQISWAPSPCTIDTIVQGYKEATQEESLPSSYKQEPLTRKTSYTDMIQNQQKELLKGIA